MAFVCDNDSRQTNEFSTITEGKLIAPGNLRATQDNAGYQELFDYWVSNTYQLRYTGGTSSVELHIHVHVQVHVNTSVIQGAEMHVAATMFEW